MRAAGYPRGMKTIAALLLTSAASPAPEVAPGGPGIDVAIITAAISASVAVIVVLLAPLAQSWRERRDDVNAKFDAAVGSLLAVQAARHIVGGLPGIIYPGDADQRAEFERQTTERSITNYIDLTGEAKTALVAVAPYVREAREWVTSGWEITEAKEPEMRKIVEQARTKAIKTERLLRRRKYPK